MRPTDTPKTIMQHGHFSALLPPGQTAIGQRRSHHTKATTPSACGNPRKNFAGNLRMSVSCVNTHTHTHTHTFASRVKIRKSALTANLAHPPFRHRVRRRSFPFTFTPTARPVSLPHFPDIGPARGRLLPAAAALRPAIWPRGRVCIHSKNTKLCTY